MTEDLLEEAAYDGIVVELRFENEKPTFGDLFSIRGFDHPNFPRSGKFNFDALTEFEFDQVDDYFGIRNEEDDGDDVKIWLSPMVNEFTVYHHHGPFDALRLSYTILRNPPENGALFLKVVSAFVQHLPVQPFYKLRGIELGNPPGLSIIELDIQEVIDYWKKQGIEVGSHDALIVDF